MNNLPLFRVTRNIKTLNHTETLSSNIVYFYQCVVENNKFKMERMGWASLYKGDVLMNIGNLFNNRYNAPHSMNVLSQ